MPAAQFGLFNFAGSMKDGMSLLAGEIITVDQPSRRL
jgi:hypothetical protein